MLLVICTAAAAFGAAAAREFTASEQEEHARRHVVAFLTRVPASAGRAGARLDKEHQLPRFGIEFEYVAGAARTCDYRYEAFTALARRVAQLVGVSRAGFSDFGTREAPYIKWRDVVNRSWEVHADDLFGNDVHSAARKLLEKSKRLGLGGGHASRLSSSRRAGAQGFTRGARDFARAPTPTRASSAAVSSAASALVSAAPGFEVTTPPLDSAAFALRLMRWLFRSADLAVVTPCGVPHSTAAGHACGAIAAQPDHQRLSVADPSSRGSTAACPLGLHHALNVSKVPPLIPSFHVHVDGARLCGDTSCRGLINLMLLHERYEYILRRLFPIYGPPDNSLPARMAAPELLRELGGLTRSQRTRAAIARLLRKYEHQLRLGQCLLQLPAVIEMATTLDDVASSRSDLPLQECVRRLPLAMVWRWWSLKPYTMLGLDAYSTARSAVEFRSAAMGNGAYPLMLRVQLCRMMVKRAAEMEGDLGWDAEAARAQDGISSNGSRTSGAHHSFLHEAARRLAKTGDAPWGPAVRKVEARHMLELIDMLRFAPAVRKLFAEYIKTLDAPLPPASDEELAAAAAKSTTTDGRDLDAAHHEDKLFDVEGVPVAVRTCCRTRQSRCTCAKHARPPYP